MLKIQDIEKNEEFFGEINNEFEGFTLSFAFLPNGDLISGGNEGKIKIWDLVIIV